MKIAMPYTEFRKSYGDFEIVIPAVDFSLLSRLDAFYAVQMLRQYRSGYVSHYMMDCGLNYPPLNRVVIRQFYNDGTPSFSIYHQSGIALRKAWCEHMANEIEHEFGFTR